MRTRAAVASVLASLAVLIGGWELGAAGTTGSPLASGSTAGTAGAGTGTTEGPAAATGTPTPLPSARGSVAASPAASPAATAAASPSSGVDGTWTGSSVTTRFGAVQVAITVAGGRITDVAALHLTDQDRRSVSISNRAAPILRQEVLAAQSADVQAVSGATYTSDGYLTSLQSAIDQAGL